MAKEKWAKAYVKANIRETEKGYHCEMPDLMAYPAGAVTMMIGKPVDQVSAPLLLAELLYSTRRPTAMTPSGGHETQLRKATATAHRIRLARIRRPAGLIGWPGVRGYRAWS